MNHPRKEKFDCWFSFLVLGYYFLKVVFLYIFYLLGFLFNIFVTFFRQKKRPW